MRDNIHFIITQKKYKLQELLEPFFFYNAHFYNTCLSLLILVHNEDGKTHPARISFSIESCYYFIQGVGQPKDKGLMLLLWAHFCSFQFFKHCPWPDQSSFHVLLHYWKTFLWLSQLIQSGTGRLSARHNEEATKMLPQIPSRDTPTQPLLSSLSLTHTRTRYRSPIQHGAELQ